MAKLAINATSRLRSPKCEPLAGMKCAASLGGTNHILFEGALLSTRAKRQFCVFSTPDFRTAQLTATQDSNFLVCAKSFLHQAHDKNQFRRCCSEVTVCPLVMCCVEGTCGRGCGESCARLSPYCSVTFVAYDISYGTKFLSSIARVGSGICNGCPMRELDSARASPLHQDSDKEK